MKKSKKKLSDFFRDQKFSSKQKQECLLLLSDEKIAWIIGNRRTTDSKSPHLPVIYYKSAFYNKI